MKVRVGISTHNRSSLLEKSLESVFQQDYPDLEVAVIDDASTDDTDSLRKRYPSVFWSREESKKGQVKARNRLMRETDADLYVSLDDDAWFLAGDEISQAVSVLQRDPDIAAIAFDILSPDQSNQRDKGPPVEVSTFIGCGHVVRLSSARNVGLYTEWPGLYGSEEPDLCIRLIDKGKVILKMPGVHVWHHKENFSADIRWKHRSGTANALVFAVRRYPIPWVIWLLPMKMMSHLLFAFRMRLFVPYVEGLADFFRAVPNALRTRAPVKVSTLRRFNRLARR